jgi:hypothetical protein
VRGCSYARANLGARIDRDARVVRERFPSGFKDRRSLRIPQRTSLLETKPGAWGFERPFTRGAGFSPARGHRFGTTVSDILIRDRSDTVPWASNVEITE